MTFNTRNPLLRVPLSTSFKTGTGVSSVGFHETTAHTALRPARHGSSAKAALLLGGLSVQGTGEPGTYRPTATATTDLQVRHLGRRPKAMMNNVLFNKKNLNKITNKSIRELLGGIYKVSVSCGRKESLLPSPPPPKGLQIQEETCTIQTGQKRICRPDWAQKPQARVPSGYEGSC